VACASLIHPPVRLLTKGISGARRVTPRATSSKRATIGSIIREWKACEVCSRWWWTPRASSSAANASTASPVPPTTVSAGPLTVQRSSSAGRTARTSLSGSETESMAPAGISCISAPRTATRRSASSSDITPARQAAAYSPMLWPAKPSGSSPQCIHSLASAYSTAKRAGWASAVCRSRAEASSSSPAGGWRMPRRSSPRWGRSSSQQRSSSSRKTGSCR